MSRCPSAVESKATCRPSGDQRGLPTWGPSKEVTWTGFEPSASHIQSSKVPVREEEKTIFFPSREYWGLSSDRVDEISFAGGLAPAPFVPRSSIRQMFTS